jgi:hypothetical protein
MRFTFSGYLILVTEVVIKLYQLFVYGNLLVVPSVVMHIVLFLCPMAFYTRLGIHTAWNIFSVVGRLTGLYAGSFEHSLNELIGLCAELETINPDVVNEPVFVELIDSVAGVVIENVADESLIEMLVSPPTEPREEVAVTFSDIAVPLVERVHVGRNDWFARLFVAENFTVRPLLSG